MVRLEGRQQWESFWTTENLTPKVQLHDVETNWKFTWFYTRFERWPSPQLHLPIDTRTSYEGNYTDDSETWRPVVLSRLVSHDLHQLADKNICISAGKRKSCSIEAVLRATPRFQSLANSNILLLSMVQVCSCMFNSALSIIRFNDMCSVDLLHLLLRDVP